MVSHVPKRPDNMTLAEVIEWIKLYTFKDGECIISHLSSDARGYAQVYHAGKMLKVGRLLLEDATGEAPQGRMMLHSCHNSHCVNPAHLRWGTHKENMRDCRLAGRTGGLRASDDQVREIRRLRQSGVKPHAIAGRVGTTYYTVRNIIYGTAGSLIQ